MQRRVGNSVPEGAGMLISPILRRPAVPVAWQSVVSLSSLHPFIAKIGDRTVPDYYGDHFSINDETITSLKIVYDITT